MKVTVSTRWTTKGGALIERVVTSESHEEYIVHEAPSAGPLRPGPDLPVAQPVQEAVETPPADTEPTTELPPVDPGLSGGEFQPVLGSAPSISDPYTASYPGRAKPSIVRGVKTALAAGVGGVGAMLGYVQTQLGTLSEFSWELLIPVGVGALVAGGIYACDRALRPNAKF